MDLKDQLKSLFPDHIETENSYEQEVENNQKVQIDQLICKYEKKGRNGKPVTIIENFNLNENQIKDLAKDIKTKLGIGGSVKDLTIIVQGNYREQIIEILNKKGFKTKRVGG